MHSEAVETTAFVNWLAANDQHVWNITVIPLNFLC